MLAVVTMYMGEYLAQVDAQRIVMPHFDLLHAIFTVPWRRYATTRRQMVLHHLVHCMSVDPCAPVARHTSEARRQLERVMGVRAPVVDSPLSCCTRPVSR